LLFEAVRLFTNPAYGIEAPATLEAVGFRIGRQLSERYSKDKPRLGDTLEVIKFVCKDFWQAVFKKQVDNLKTNHRGIYVLQDNNFRWVGSITPSGPMSESSRADYLSKAAQPYLYLPCGIIRGAFDSSWLDLHRGGRCQGITKLLLHCEDYRIELWCAGGPGGDA